jgi:hypothetical protein
MMDQLSADQRRVIAGLTAPVSTALDPLFDKVLAIQVSASVEPAADRLGSQACGSFRPVCNSRIGRQ